MCTASLHEEKAKVQAAAPEPTVSALDDQQISEKRILRKLDWHLLPFVSLLYLLSFLYVWICAVRLLLFSLTLWTRVDSDRSNIGTSPKWLLVALAWERCALIGNANVAGLSVDLKLQGLQYNICAAVFFITYAAFEVPRYCTLFSSLGLWINVWQYSNMAMKRFRPSVWSKKPSYSWAVHLLNNFILTTVPTIMVSFSLFSQTCYDPHLCYIGSMGYCYDPYVFNKELSWITCVRVITSFITIKLMIYNS